MKPVKLAIIGCGIAAQDLHWPALKELRDKYEIVAVCNHTPEKARLFSQMVGGVPYMLDYRQILAMPEVEAVDIALPIELNYQVTREALAAGKHVLVEKPLAANLEEAKSMVELAKSYPQVTMVAENFRYRRIFAKIRSVMAQKTIGEVYAVFWDCLYKEDLNNKYVQTQWRIHHQYPGGFVTDGGIHNIAVLRDLFGEIYGVSSLTKTVNPDIGELDFLSLQFTAPHHVSGVFNLFFSANSYHESKLVILGKSGCLTMEDDLLTVKQHDQIIETVKYENDFGYHEEFMDFYQAIREGQPVISSFFEAYGDLRVMIHALNIAIK
jgi:predicted dehydrogenase